MAEFRQFRRCYRIERRFKRDDSIALMFDRCGIASLVPSSQITTLAEENKQAANTSAGRSVPAPVKGQSVGGLKA